MVKKKELNISLPESRSFYLGMTPFAYDDTPQAAEETYSIVAEHTDLICHHFDGGVPWIEAFEGKPYHPKVEEDINSRLRHLQKDQKVYLSITPQIHDRKSLAGYWGEEHNMERPSEWEDKNYDDPDVIKAYLNYARYMIRRFNPDYMAYGIEVDGGFRDTDPDFEKFLVFVKQVYTTLKSENPDLPLFLTFQTRSFSVKTETIRRVDKRLLKFTDYIAISTYPYYWFPGHPPDEKADPHDLPVDWFSQMAKLAPEKPFAVAETGFIAEDLIIKSLGINMKGREEWQAEYVKFLLNEANKLNAKFVVWFCPVDYDIRWEKMKKRLPEPYKLWRDTGLLDENRSPRLALKIWDAWLRLPVK